MCPDGPASGCAGPKAGGVPQVHLNTFSSGFAFLLADRAADIFRFAPWKKAAASCETKLSMW